MCTIILNGKRYKKLNEDEVIIYKNYPTTIRFKGDDNWYRFIGEEIAHLTYDWNVIKEKKCTKADLMMDCGLSKFNFDFALPQQWLNDFVDMHKIDYHMVIFTTVWVYTDYYRLGVPCSCCTEVQTILDSIRKDY